MGGTIRTANDLVNNPRFQRLPVADRLKVLATFETMHRPSSSANPSPPMVSGPGGVVADAAEGAWQVLEGLPAASLAALRQASPTGLSGLETASNIATPSPLTSRISESPKNAAISLVPGANAAIGLADLIARLAGYKPLANETIGEAQNQIGEAAGQAAMMALMAKISDLANNQPDKVSAGKNKISTALAVPGGKGGLRAAKMEEDIETAAPHLAKISREGELTPPSLMDKLHGRGTPQWFDDTARNIDDYKNKLWKDSHEAPVQRHALAPFDWQKVASEADSEVLPEDDSTQARLAKSWVDREIPKLKTLKSADVKVRLLNQEIKSLPERYGPVGARVRLAALKALRGEIDNELESMGEPGVRQANKEWGALNNIQTRLQERYYQETGKAARSSPIPEWMHVYAFGHPGGVAAGIGVRLGSMFRPTAAMQLYKGLRLLQQSGIEPPPVFIPFMRTAAGLLGEGPKVTPPPADESFVIGYPAMQEAPAAVRLGRLLAEHAGAPFEMPASSAVEVIPKAERVPGKYAGMLDQNIKSIGPNSPESAMPGGRLKKLTGIAGRLKPSAKSLLDTMARDKDVSTLLEIYLKDPESDRGRLALDVLQRKLGVLYKRNR